MSRKINWREAFSGSFAENQPAMLEYLGIDRPEDVGIVQVRLDPDPDHPKGYAPEEGKYWSMVFVDFLNKYSDKTLGRWYKIENWERKAANCFFRGVHDHPGFLRSFRTAQTIRTNQKVEN